MPFGLTTLGNYGEVSESGGVSNPGEVGLVVSLVVALLNGGISSADVAVIAPYSAQVKLFKVMNDAIYRVGAICIFWLFLRFRLRYFLCFILQFANICAYFCGNICVAQ